MLWTVQSLWFLCLHVAGVRIGCAKGTIIIHSPRSNSTVSIRSCSFCRLLKCAEAVLLLSVSTMSCLSLIKCWNHSQFTCPKVYRHCFNHPSWLFSARIEPGHSTWQYSNPITGGAGLVSTTMETWRSSYEELKWKVISLPTAIKQQSLGNTCVKTKYHIVFLLNAIDFTIWMT